MTKKLFIKTYGCQMNVYDSIKMQELLDPFGFESTNDMSQADMVILNTCHIREKATEKVYSEIGILSKLKERRQEIGSNLIIAVSRNIDSLNKLVKEKNTHSILPIKSDVTNPLHLKKIFKIIKGLNLPLDVLINNAGQIVNKPFEKITNKDLQLAYQTNVFGPFMLIQLLLPLMNKKNNC